MLTGSDLLNKVKELGDVSKSDLVRACGYVTNKKDGGDRLNFTAFYEALLEAKGVSLGTTGIGGIGKGGRKLSYVATVQGNGNLLIGTAYTALLELKPGDEFEIKLGRKQIRLVPVGGGDEERAPRRPREVVGGSAQNCGDLGAPDSNPVLASLASLASRSQTTAAGVVLGQADGS